MVIASWTTLFDHSLEYSALIETSQTHSQRVHHKFDVKKRRVVQDALTIPAAYEKITPPCPLLSIETNKYEELRENQLSAVDPLDPLTSLDSPRLFLRKMKVKGERISIINLYRDCCFPNQQLQSPSYDRHRFSTSRLWDQGEEIPMAPRRNRLLYRAWTRGRR
jgi:hypothetical protein